VVKPLSSRSALTTATPARVTTLLLKTKCSGKKPGSRRVLV